MLKPGESGAKPRVCKKTVPCKGETIRVIRLHIRVPRLEHRRESRRLFLPAPFCARLFEAPMQPHLYERLLAIQFLFQPAQSFIDRLAFFQMHFRHINFWF
jgi:hypothetical protein